MEQRGMAGTFQDVAAMRTVVLASADAALRSRLRSSLTGLRWEVYEAAGGAEALERLERERPEALMVDSWLPDLEAGEFVGQIRTMFPAVELIGMDGGVEHSVRSPRRHELLHALREAQDAGGSDTAAWRVAPVAVPTAAPMGDVARRTTRESLPAMTMLLPEMVGASAPMSELAELIRLVAPRTATVLIEGETGTGKEVVAKAIHKLSERASKPFVVLNCAAIPESLLEAELFGHTRGAFTGAVQSRTGRIEAAHGGTLFLDEIGEMPLALQAKMLRFLEYGELQRVGDNETMRVDVRVVAATHQPLEKRSEEGSFRLDLYHRLAVFPVEVPPLRERMEDLPMLAEHLLAALGQRAPRKHLHADALERLRGHHWPGNVRELMHVLERAAILSADRMEIGADEIRYRRATR
ncbi:MAG: sigma-54 dependent transcriptional regulator [Edaphobacter sp.]|uniref:sigma-54 dependent transcriptional regulator n=1 Tax=Edaphobacter sp. TaxID=1934404 RepID=UPI00238EB9CC|nr:sigma-54 dependent transcriptional regulator [Edaphobacter sp.]MDE1178366.1 sigma-54 dependent transcriptional regulator [Edaphobacter sp.]